MTTRERQVLVKIGRNSGEYHSAILNALDTPVAEGLVGAGLARRCMFVNWFNLTARGVRVARGVLAAVDAGAVAEEGER